MSAKKSTKTAKPESAAELEKKLAKVRAELKVAKATIKDNEPKIKELHACLGLNGCKGHGRGGKNDCAGTGHCATAEIHLCHTLNNCRNQGGCGLYGTGDEQNNPGNNDCSWQGSCAVPINAERFSTEGPNKGKSVWIRAREIFEEKMEQAGRQYGKPPKEHSQGPSSDWLNEKTQLGSYTACGSSGMSGGGTCS